MGILRWTRADQGALEALSWVVPTLAALAAAARAVAAVRGEPLEVVRYLPETLLRPGSGAQGPLTGTVVLSEPTPGQQALALVPDLLVLVLAICVAVLLNGVVRALRSGEPFTPGSARRLAVLALVLGVGGVLQQFVSQAVRDSLVKEVSPLGERLPVVFELSFWPLGAMLLLAFFAEVFARGAKLRADVDGLV